MTWEHLQSVLIQVQQRRVRELFSDVESTDDDDITTPRSSLRSACLLRDSDSALITALRLWLYYIILEGGETLAPPLYTMPLDRYQQEVKFMPQVTLYFREDLDDVEEGYKPIDAELSFRLAREQYNTVTPANAETLAQRIHSEFATGSGYRWRKGRVKLAYRDRENGYQFSVNAYSESEGREIIQKVLDLQTHVLDPAHLTITELGNIPAIVPPTEHIYGKSRRTPRRRPVGWVRFRYAELHVWGVNKPITLVDRTYRRHNALITA